MFTLEASPCTLTCSVVILLRWGTLVLAIPLSPSVHLPSSVPRVRPASLSVVPAVLGAGYVTEHGHAQGSQTEAPRPYTGP